MIANYPVIAIPVDVKYFEENPFHVVGEKYINAIAHGSKCFPILLPAFAEGKQLKALTEQFSLEKLMTDIDGVFLPGSTSNLNPEIYGQSLETPDLPRDSQRDMTTLPLIKLAIKNEIPLLAVCRGFQELNVAFGGSLYQKVHEIEGYFDHREDTSAEKALQYQHAHKVNIVSDGLLYQCYKQTQGDVNSLHGQGIKEVGQGLKIEATADDQLVEALSVEGAKSFALGVQWHPEWNHENDELSISIFSHFGDAVRNRHQSR